MMTPEYRSLKGTITGEKGATIKFMVHAKYRRTAAAKFPLFSLGILGKCLGPNVR